MGGQRLGQYLGKKSAAETSNGAAYKLYQNGMELGGDVVTLLENSQLIAGGFVSLTNNNVKHARGGTSSVDSYGSVCMPPGMTIVASTLIAH